MTDMKITLHYEVAGFPLRQQLLCGLVRAMENAALHAHNDASGVRLEVVYSPGGGMEITMTKTSITVADKFGRTRTF